VSDFLSRLAERALGAAPPLQPLVGSRFAAPAEPASFLEETAEGDGFAPTVRRSVADTFPAAPPRPVAEAPVSAGEEPSSTLVPTPSPSPPPSESRTPSPVEGRTRSPDRTVPTVDVREVASSSRPFEHDDAALPAREVAPSARASEANPPSPVRASSQVPAERAEERRPRAEPRRVTEPRGELLMPASAPPDPPVFSSTAHRQEDGSAPLSGVEARRRVAGDSVDETQPMRQVEEPADDREHASDALLMPLARRGEAQAVDGDRADGPRADARQPWAPVEKERPVVQVTIGRIEVRAVHPPAAPQPARGPGWTPPVLSLDEYLKRGGGR
jgi:hypothetical protein